MDDELRRLHERAAVIAGGRMFGRRQFDEMDALQFAVELLRLRGLPCSEPLLLKYLRAMHLGKMPIRPTMLPPLPRW
jgi:hypothetical protein